MSEDLPLAVIFDVDGTLCDVRDISYLILPSHPQYPGYRDFDAFHRASLWCKPNRDVKDDWQSCYSLGAKIIIMTSRRSRYAAWTQSWLASNEIWYDEIHFRPDEDFSPGVDIKRRMYEDVRQRYHVTDAWEDSPDIIALWKELGLTVHEIPGWFDPADWQDDRA